jgi:hypothetical protein
MLFATHYCLELLFISKNMIPRFKKKPKFVNKSLNKEEFLEEYNKLSPVNLKTNISSLSRFKVDKASLFKDDTWSVDRLRKPLISWLISSDLESHIKK